MRLVYPEGGCVGTTCPDIVGSRRRWGKQWRRARHPRHSNAHPNSRIHEHLFFSNCKTTAKTAHTKKSAIDSETVTVTAGMAGFPRMIFNDSLNVIDDSTTCNLHHAREKRRNETQRTSQQASLSPVCQ